MWTLVDSLTGKRATVASYPTSAQAQRSLDNVRRRVESGARHDLVDILPRLVVAEDPGGRPIAD